MARRTSPVTPPDDDIDDTAAPDANEQESAAIDALLEECGSTTGLWMRVSRVEPVREYVTRIDDASTFDIEQLKRSHGGGVYELTVYRHGQAGIVRRARVTIDRSFRPARTDDAPDAARPQALGTMELFSMMMQNATESQRQQTQLLAAVISKPAQTMDPTLLALLTQRSSASELAELMKLSREVAPDAGDGVSIANVLVQALTAFAASAPRTPPTALRPAVPGRPAALPPPVEAQKRASGTESHYGRSERGATPTTPTPHPTAPNGNRPIQSQNSPAGVPTNPPEGSPEAPATPAEIIQAVFAGVPADPNPLPIVYAATLIQALTPQAVEAAVKASKEGELADQVASMVAPMPAGFLEAVEDYLREIFDPEDAPDETPDPGAASAALRIEPSPAAVAAA